jgi:hypothetical protein
MAKIVLAFLVITFVIHFGIMSWRSLTGLEKWSLTKNVFYSIMISAVSILLMVGLVIVF